MPKKCLIGFLLGETKGTPSERVATESRTGFKEVPAPKWAYGGYRTVAVRHRKAPERIVKAAYKYV